MSIVLNRKLQLYDHGRVKKSISKAALFAFALSPVRARSKFVWNVISRIVEANLLDAIGVY